uniref:Serpin domain-containing protein n=1 Tax=Panagrolaimus davidi TaxID=227884 RepID=A0A914Q0K0_9BILA
MVFNDDVAFACKILPLLLQKLHSVDSESIVFSPTSILSELSILYSEANKVENIIGKINDLKKEEFIKNVIQSLHRYKETAGIQDDDIIVTIANKLFLSLNNDVLFTPEFCEFLKKPEFQAHFQRVDFNSKVALTQEINKFIESSLKTNQTTDIVFNEEEEEKGDDVVPNKTTNLIIANAVYFIAPWNNAFASKKEDEIFFSIPQKKIKMMGTIVVKKMKWNLIQNEKWDCVGIPYKNFKAWMYIVLPKHEYSLAQLLKDITNESFLKWTKKDESFFEKDNKFYALIPFINISTNLKLKEILKAAEIKNVLSSKSQNFEIINEIFHSTSFKIDDEGSGAKSIVARYAVLQNSLRYTFNANRPFLYFVTTNEMFIDDNDEIPKMPKNLLFIGTFC